MVFGIKQIKKIEQVNKNLSYSLVVDRFLYKNEDNNYFIALCSLPKKEKFEHKNKSYFLDKIVILGYSENMIKNISLNEEIEVFAEIELGKQEDTIQLKVSTIKEKIPTNNKSIEAFLSSGKIKGIGSVLAKKIVKKFGKNTIDILDNKLELLSEIEGLGNKKIEEIRIGWKKWRNVHEIVGILASYGISDTIGNKIFDKYGSRAMEIIKSDPFELTEIEGIGFKTADKIANANGVKPDDPKRIQKCILYFLEESAQKGSTALILDDLIFNTKKFLNLSENIIIYNIEKIKGIDLIIFKNKIKVYENSYSDKFSLEEKTLVCHKKYYYAEKEIATNLKRLLDSKYKKDFLNDNTEINSFLEKNEFELDKSQIEAAKILLENKVSILTGGPGTGKTHTIKSLISFFENLNTKNEKTKNTNEINVLEDFKIVLAAPTGRAAKKMNEATDKESSTIHSLLGYAHDGGFEHNEYNKLKGDVFILDETSMNDIWIEKAFLAALPDHAKVIFIGDIDQLSSVGPGNVLKDKIESNLIPTARITEIHRQAKNSDIILASHAVINKKIPKLNEFNSDSDFVFIQEQDIENIFEKVKSVVKNLKSKNINDEDIQILTPKKETLVGVNNLNYEMRDLLNSKNLSSIEEDCKFAINDRVMQFKNDKDNDIYNGEIGFVKYINHMDNETTFEFGKKNVTISNSNLENINLAYAMTIHKSQGSDFPYVIIPVDKSHQFMWDTNLLYTAITRGKKRVILIGDEKTLKFAISNTKQNTRITTLPIHFNEWKNNSLNNVKKLKFGKY